MTSNRVVSLSVLACLGPLIDCALMMLTLRQRAIEVTPKPADDAGEELSDIAATEEVTRVD